MGKYYIHETARLLGLSDQALRFFEKKGIITARRDERGYRYYDENDIGRLLAYQNLRCCGFNMEETVEVLNIGDEDLAASVLQDKIRALEQKMCHMEATVEYLREQARKLKRCFEREIRLKRKLRPRFFVIPARLGGTRQWVEAIPIVRSAMLLPVNHRDNLDLEILYILEADDCKRYGLEALSQIPGVKVWEPQMCLHGMFWLKEGQPGAKGVIQTYLDDHGITRTGPVLFYPVWKVEENGQPLSCSEAWIPVE